MLLTQKECATVGVSFWPIGQAAQLLGKTNRNQKFAYNCA